MQYKSPIKTIFPAYSDESIVFSFFPERRFLSGRLRLLKENTKLSILGIGAEHYKEHCVSSLPSIRDDRESSDIEKRKLLRIILSGKKVKRKSRTKAKKTHPGTPSGSIRSLRVLPISTKPKKTGFAPVMKWPKQSKTIRTTRKKSSTSVSRSLSKKTSSKMLCSISTKPLPKDDPVKRKPDITMAKEVLGWKPKVKLEEGSKRTIEYFKEII